MAYYTYSFDKGTGERYRGRTNDPKRRRSEHERKYPRMRDWRTYTHKTEKRAREHERHLHTLDG